MKLIGTIIAASHTAVDNAGTATPFVIPPSVRRLVLIPDQAIAVRSGTTGTVATANDFPIASGNPAPPMVTGIPDTTEPLVSVYSTSGSTATVKVYALFAPLYP